MAKATAPTSPTYLAAPLVGRVQQAEPRDRAPQAGRITIRAAALVALVLAAYLPAAVHGGFIWDDDDHITNNPTLRSLDGLHDIWLTPGATPQYYPLTHTTFWVEYHLWGTNPTGYHVDNILLHAISAVLLWRLLAALGLPAAWFAAALWAIHPVNVESVAWATERKNVLSGLLYLLSFYAYLRTTARFHSGWWYLSYALFVLALLAKTVACSLPAAVLLVLWWQNGRLRWRDVMPLLPFFIAGGAMSVMTAYMEKSYVMAAGPEWDWLTPAHRILIAGRAVWFYAAKLLWPTKLCFIYPHWDVDPHRLAQWIFPIALVTTIAAAWLLRRRVGRGPVAAILFFCGTLVPALGFVNLYPMRYSFVADHFQYLASAGLLVLLAEMGRWLWSRAVRAAPSWIIASPVLVVLSVLTFHRCYVYAGEEPLWNDTLEKNPSCWMAHQNLGRFLVIRHKDADLKNAAVHFREAFQIKNNFNSPRYAMADLLDREGKPDEAVSVLRDAVAAEPGEMRPYYRLAVQLGRAGDYAAAAEEYARSYELHLERTGTPTTAAAAQAAALSAGPPSPDAQLHLAESAEAAGRNAEAIAHYLAALRLAPDDPVARAGFLRTTDAITRPPPESR